MKIYLFALALTSLSPLPLNASECVRWFLDAGLIPGQDNCDLKCSITPVDMGSFQCSDQCPDLCEQSLSQLLIYAPRLTDGDKALVSRFPIQAIKVFRAKNKTDDLTLRIFKTTRKNDESDAFRHFVWSSLVTQDLGEKDARMFLNAHETDPTQSKKEKEMDLANNELGILFVLEKRKANAKIELIDIEREALSRLRNGQLTVIEKKFEKIPDGYYSK